MSAKKSPTCQSSPMLSKRAGLAAAAMLVAATVSFAGSVVYTYDSLGRLAKATYSSGLVVGFSYDAAGNRTSYVITGAAT
jgi:YD repeat-containing protein